MIKQNVMLFKVTNFQIGGPAKFFVEASSLEELKQDLGKIDSSMPRFILGSGTNILVKDEGFEGVVIAPKFKFINLNADFSLTVGASVSWDELNTFCIEHSLSGLEWSGGLPGSVGGAVWGNAGAFGGETKDNILKVESVKLNTFEKITRTKAELKFDYRSSIFKKELANLELIYSVAFQMTLGDKEKIRTQIAEKMDYRKNRQPLDLPSAGSTFKNVPAENLTEEIHEKFSDKIKNDPFEVLPAAVLINEAGLKGQSVGDAQISTVHPNFIVNRGKATSKDVLALIELVKKDVFEKFKVNLETEVITI